MNTFELRKALLLKAAGKGDPKREKLVFALAEQAGGIENAFAAALALRPVCSLLTPSVAAMRLAESF